MKIYERSKDREVYRKLRRRIDELGHARELTFSCYQGYRFLQRDRTRQWFVDAVAESRNTNPVDLWAYVIMPEHVHILLYPREPGVEIGWVVGRIKESVARKAIRFLENQAPHWLPRLTVTEGKRKRRRFWQPGGGYDRNCIDHKTLQRMVDYIHMNPVRRGLVKRPEDWYWSSARWYAGLHPVPIEMDPTLPVIQDDSR